MYVLVYSDLIYMWTYGGKDPTETLIKLGIRIATAILPCCREFSFMLPPRVPLRAAAILPRQREPSSAPCDDFNSSSLGRGRSRCLRFDLFGSGLLGYRRDRSHDPDLVGPRQLPAVERPRPAPFRWRWSTRPSRLYHHGTHTMLTQGKVRRWCHSPTPSTSAGGLRTRRFWDYS